MIDVLVTGKLIRDPAANQGASGKAVECIAELKKDEAGAESNEL
jgi:hypothetical protein